MRAPRSRRAASRRFSLGGKFSWMTMRFTDFFIEHFAGPKLHDSIKTMEASWDQEPVVKAFAKLKEWNTKGYFNAGFLNVDPATNMQLVYQGKAAMVLEVPTIEITRLKRENIDPNTYGTFVMPTDQTPRRVSGFQQQLQISAKAPKDVQDAALLFATYVVRPELAAKHMQSMGGPSAVKGVSPGPEMPIQSQDATWLKDGLQLFLPGRSGAAARDGRGLFRGTGLRDPRHHVASRGREERADRHQRVQGSPEVSILPRSKRARAPISSPARSSSRRRLRSTC
jgi:ABC-type glycerol-3-phosphate transport system substrate-binding protein